MPTAANQRNFLHTALLLSASSSTRGKTSIALAANLLFAVVLASEGLERGLNDTTTQTEDEVKGGLLLDVVVAQSAAILELLAGEDETLLIRGNTFLVLDLLLDILNSVGGFDLKSDGLAYPIINEFILTICDLYITKIYLIFQYISLYRSKNVPVRVLTKICIPPRRRRTK